MIYGRRFRSHSTSAGMNERTVNWPEFKSLSEWKTSSRNRLSIDFLEGDRIRFASWCDVGRYPGFCGTIINFSYLWMDGWNRLKSRQSGLTWLECGWEESLWPNPSWEENWLSLSRRNSSSLFGHSCRCKWLFSLSLSSVGDRYPNCHRPNWLEVG